MLRHSQLTVFTADQGSGAKKLRSDGNVAARTG
jgi:hypothetical protein